jgi:hypothetical protein
VLLHPTKDEHPLKSNSINTSTTAAAAAAAAAVAAAAVAAAVYDGRC